MERGGERYPWYGTYGIESGLMRRRAVEKRDRGDCGCNLYKHAILTGNTNNSEAIKAPADAGKYAKQRYGMVLPYHATQTTTASMT